jgi:asparagine synthase (glutamine-hydrolysing)
VCGIIGILNGMPSDVDLSLTQIRDCLHHRGPDSFGEFADKKIAMGINRLAIVDVENGHQPYFSENKSIVCVFNGQIYNFKKLQEMLLLKGHILNSQADGEVIVHLYEEYGPDFVKLLSGMFAIALWDSKLEKLILFRDHIGKKPLLYATDSSGRLCFGSEMKVLTKLMGFKSSDISEESLFLMLSFGYVPSPQTIFKNCFKIEPGSYIEFTHGKQNEVKYWEPIFEANTENLETNLLELDFLLNQSVAKRVSSERSMGAFLSGGIDSSLIVHYLNQNTEEPVETFSVGFDDPKFDESVHSLAVAELLETNHHVLQLSENSVKNEFLSLYDKFDEPFADSSALATAMLSEFASEKIVVALSGDGGDEAFGGYDRYRALNIYVELSSLFYGAKFLIDKLHLGPFIPGRLNRLFTSLPEEKSSSEFYRKLMTIFSYENLDDIAKNNYALHKSKNWFSNTYSSQQFDDYLAGNIYDFKTYLPDDLLFKVDMASMAHSLEVRSPFLDRHIVEFGLGLPKNQRLGLQAKKILRLLALQHLPKEIINRKKMGFAIPRRKWLVGSLSIFADEVFANPDSIMYSWLKYKETNDLYQRFKEGENLDGAIWAIISFEMWARKWLEN